MLARSGFFIFSYVSLIYDNYLGQVQNVFHFGSSCMAKKSQGEQCQVNPVPGPTGLTLVYISAAGDEAELPEG